MDTTVLAKSLGLADDATEEQISAAITATAEKAAKADKAAAELETLKATKEGEKSEVETLREELATERTKRITNERDEILAAAVADGKIVPAEKETLVEAFGDNVESLRKVLDARPKNTTLARERGGAGDGGDGDVETAAERDKFESEDPVDEESLSLHAKALKIIGKKKYDEDEYLDALAQAERETVTA